MAALEAAIQEAFLGLVLVLDGRVEPGHDERITCGGVRDDSPPLPC